MGYVKKLIDKATHKDAKSTITVGRFKAVRQDGVNCDVINIYQEEKHIATLSITLPSVLGVQLEQFASFAHNRVLLSTVQRHYPNVEFKKSFLS